MRPIFRPAEMSTDHHRHHSVISLQHTHRSQAMEILEQPVLKTALLFHPGSSVSVPFYLTPEILVGNHSRITALESPLRFVGTRVRSGVKVWSALISPFGGSFSVRL
ncbi:hypothetical protein FOQG_01963 [Fusarium oxysporum f. sp. raphani 54005]|nr:hypothetical protein FOQG_01963 [Fusarium oxysporum f. sp. raphani 54005]EXL71984.1 hypothetical protein FOPG_12348 [Fusarium oxysporum f. sp. conglutinans race 2 54008]